MFSNVFSIVTNFRYARKNGSSTIFFQQKHIENDPYQEGWGDQDLPSMLQLASLKALWRQTELGWLVQHSQGKTPTSSLESTMISRRIARLLFDRKPRPHTSLTGGTALLIRWDGKLGDSIVSSFVYRELRKSGNWQVFVATTPELADLHADVFNPDKMFLTPAGPGWAALFQLWRRLGKVDVVVHLSGVLPPREIFFLWLLRPSQVYGLDDELGWVTAKLGIATESVSIQARYAEVVRRMGTQAVNTSPALPPATGHRGYIAFNPYASRAGKSMGALKAALTLSCLAKAFPDKEFRVLSSPATDPSALQLVQAVARKNVRLFEGLPTVNAAIAAVEGAEAVISVDTGIVHVAVALKKPLVAIYPSLGDNYDPWRPDETPTTKVILAPQDVATYRRTGRKNLDVFDETDIRDHLAKLIAGAAQHTPRTEPTTPPPPHC